MVKGYPEELRIKFFDIILTFKFVVFEIIKKMKVYTYIIYSQKLNIFYVGISANIKLRLKQHINSKSKFTSRTDDWELVYQQEFDSRIAAHLKEKSIKSFGAKRFLESLSSQPLKTQI